MSFFLLLYLLIYLFIYSYFRNKSVSRQATCVLFQTWQHWNDPSDVRTWSARKSEKLDLMGVLLLASYVGTCVSVRPELRLWLYVIIFNWICHVPMQFPEMGLESCPKAWVEIPPIKLNKFSNLAFSVPTSMVSLGLVAASLEQGEKGWAWIPAGRGGSKLSHFKDSMSSLKHVGDAASLDGD